MSRVVYQHFSDTVNQLLHNYCFLKDRKKEACIKAASAFHTRGDRLKWRTCMKDTNEKYLKHMKKLRKPIIHYMRLCRFWWKRVKEEESEQGEDEAIF